MLVPVEDRTFAAETDDVEFLLYGGQNRLFTVHRDNLIKLWKFPLYSRESSLDRLSRENRANTLDRLSSEERSNISDGQDRLSREERHSFSDRLSRKKRPNAADRMSYEEQPNSSDRLHAEERPNSSDTLSHEDRPSGDERPNSSDRLSHEERLNTSDRMCYEEQPNSSDILSREPSSLDRLFDEDRPNTHRPNLVPYIIHKPEQSKDSCAYRVSTESYAKPNRANDSDAQLYRVFIAEGTVRNIHVARRDQGDRFLTCEFSEAGNHVIMWNVETGTSAKVKGLSNSYPRSQVRIISVLYLSPLSLAVLVSDEGIVHTIDVWNPLTGVCTHRQMYKAYLPVQNIYNINGYLIVQPWSSMAEIIVYRVTDDGVHHKVDTGTLLTAPPNNIATYRCVVSEDTGHIIAGGSTLKIFHLSASGRLKYLRSVDLQISGKLLDVSVVHSSVLRLLIIDNSGVCVYNAEREQYTRIACEFRHRNRDILVRADSGFTYRPYVFLQDNGILLVQDTYANAFYKYEIPLVAYVPRPYAEIRKNARILCQYASASCQLPAEMWMNVLSYTGYSYCRLFARKIASKFFCRPFS